VLALLWWALIIGAAVQASRAWGPAIAVGAFLALAVIGAIPLLGGIGGLAAAVAIGASAEAALQRRLPG
jgi:hypothetical protein